MTKVKRVKLEEPPPAESQLAVINNNPRDLMDRAQSVADVCRTIVKNTALPIKGKKYVRVEGWEAIAAAHGFVAGARDVERTETGYRAIGELRRISDGTLIAQSEGFVGTDEETWSGRNEYAARAMAQTRAISRVCRSAFAHVIVLIDAELQTTPAEEMPHEEQHRPTKRYEEQATTGSPEKTTGDLLELSAWLKENGIPEGFVLALLKEKKLVAPNLAKLGNAPPGVIRRTLASRERLKVAFAASSASPTDGEAKPKGRPYQLGVQNEEGDQLDQRRMEVRQPVQTDISPADLLEQEGEEDWRTVSIHFGKQQGAQLGKIGAKSLVWWITNWRPEQWKGKWKDKDLLLDAALVLAHVEMAAVEGRQS
jgi:hypothetical protein